MSEHRPLSFWLGKLTTDTFPILRRSRDALLAMERDIDRITDDAIAAQIYHDPFLMTNLLRRVAKMPRRGLAGEVSTIDHAVMMLGMQPFFLWVKNLPLLEDVLKTRLPVLHRLQAVMACSYHAAYQSLQWSILRKDINADEVFVATIMQNRAAWAGWLLMPGEMLLIEQYMRRERVGFATAFARHTDYILDDVQIELAKLWGLPELYADFLHGHNAIRGEGAVLALKLAEAAQRGWWTPQVEKYIGRVAEWLHMPLDEVTSKIHIYSVQAARHSEGWYGQVMPVATWLPMLPGDWPEDASGNIVPSVMTHHVEPDKPDVAQAVGKPVNPGSNAAGNPAAVSANTLQQKVTARDVPGPAIPAQQKQAEPAAPSAEPSGNHVLHPEVVARIVADIRSHLDGSYDIGQLLSRVLTAMHDGLAFDRVVFALTGSDQVVKARFTLGVEEGAPMKRMNFSLVEKHLFAQLMNKMQAVWFHAPTQQKLAPLLLPKIRAQIGRGEFMAMSVHVMGKPLGFFYADYGDRGHMDENIYAGFKQLCTLTAEGLAHLSKKK